MHIYIAVVVHSKVQQLILPYAEDDLNHRRLLLSQQNAKIYQSNYPQFKVLDLVTILLMLEIFKHLKNDPPIVKKRQVAEFSKLTLKPMNVKEEKSIYIS